MKGIRVLVSIVLAALLAAALSAGTGAAAKPKKPKCLDLRVTIVGQKDDKTVTGTNRDDVILSKGSNVTGQIRLRR